MKKAEVKILIPIAVLVLAVLTFSTPAVSQISREEKVAIEALVGKIKRLDHYMRLDTIQSLGKPDVGEFGARVLIEFINDKDYDVERAAKKGLINIGLPAVRPLLEASKDEPVNFWININRIIVQSLIHTLANWMPISFDNIRAD